MSDCGGAGGERVRDESGRRLITDNGCCNIACPKTPLKTNCLLLVCLGRVERGVKYEAISGSIPVSD